MSCEGDDAISRMRKRLAEAKDCPPGLFDPKPEPKSQTLREWAAQGVPLGKQARKVLAHLQNEGPIDTYMALTRYGISRLAAVVFNLREAGYEIKTERREVTKADGTTAKVARYWLVKS